MEAEFWAHHYADNAGKGEEFEDEDYDVDEILASLEAGEAPGDDDEWETVVDG